MNNLISNRVYDKLLDIGVLMGSKSSKYRKYVRTLIKDDGNSNLTSSPGKWTLPLEVVKTIINLAVGDFFPSNWFSNIVRVCKLWLKISIKSIKIIDYRYPFLYDSSRSIAGCELIARWLTPMNHLNVLNQIEAVSVGFGVDPLGFILVLEKLCNLETLKSLRVNFLSHNLTKERLISVFKIVGRNKAIRKLDISSNHCDNRLCMVIQNSFIGGNSLTQGLREFHYSNAKINGFQFNACLRGMIEAPTLIGINFSRNRIDDADIEITIALLNNSKYLKFIDLSRNRLGQSSCQKIISTCINNKIVKKLNLIPNLNSKYQYINQSEIQILKLNVHHQLNNYLANNLKNIKILI